MNEKKPLVGIAWHHHPAETYEAVCKAVEAAGGIPVLLGQVFSADLAYDKDGILTGCKDDAGLLTAEAAGKIRRNTWHGSNAESVMNGLKAVVFPGGGDVCSSLYAHPQPPESLEGVCAERDVSDYLLMSYCLDRDISILAICRGIQVLAIVSGAEMIQDIGCCMQSLGKEYGYEHREEPSIPGKDMDFTFHDVAVISRDSILYRLIGEETVSGVPSWHHQAVKNVNGTQLVVTGIAETSGIDLIEAVERPDKTFVLGVQYHPEIGVVRGLEDSSLVYFTAIVEESSRRTE